MFIPKKDGGLRACMDYRRLNHITIKDRYTLPLIKELQATIAGAKLFTKLDLKEAYHQVQIKEMNGRQHSGHSMVTMNTV